MHRAYCSYSRPYYGENLFTLSSTSSSRIDSKSKVNVFECEDDDDENKNEQTKLLLEAKKSNGYFDLTENQQLLATTSNETLQSVSSNSLINSNINENAHNCKDSMCDLVNKKCDCTNNQQQECKKGCTPLLSFNKDLNFTNLNSYVLKILIFLLFAILVIMSNVAAVFYFKDELDNFFSECSDPISNKFKDVIKNFFENVHRFGRDSVLKAYAIVFAFIFLIIIHFTFLRRRAVVNFIFFILYVALLSVFISSFVYYFNYDNSLLIIPGVIIIVFCLILFSLQTRIQFTRSYLLPYCLAIFIISLGILIYSLIQKFLFERIKHFLLNIVIYILLISFFIIFNLQFILSNQYRFKIYGCDNEYLFKAFNMLSVDLINIPILLLNFLHRFVR